MSGSLYLPILKSVLTLGLLVWGWAVAERGLRHCRDLWRAERWSAAATFLAAAWGTVMTLLGLARLFRFEVVLVCMGVLTAGAWWMMGGWPKVEKGEAPLREVMEDIGVPAFAVFLLPLTSMLYFLQLGARMPIFYFDDLFYHVPIAVNTLHDAGYRFYPGGSMLVNYFSRLGESWQTLMLMATETLRLLDVVQWPFGWLASLSVYGLCRRWGVGRGGALVGATIPLLSPIVAYQTMSAYVDLQLSCWIVVAAGAVLGARPGKVGTVRVFWFFTACGLGLGTKWSMVTVSVILGILAVIYWGRGAFFGTPVRVRTTLAALAISCAVGLPWLIRNTVLWGSPIYPYWVEVAGVRLFDGPADPPPMPQSPWGDKPYPEQLIRAWTGVDWKNWGRLDPFGAGASALPKRVLTALEDRHAPDQRFGGFGLQWLVILLPSIAIGYVLSRMKKAGTEEEELWRRRWLALTLTVLACLVFLISSWLPRFSIYLIFLSGVGVATMWDLMRGKRFGRVAGWVLLFGVCGFDWLTIVRLNYGPAILAQWHADMGEVRNESAALTYWMHLDEETGHALYRLADSAEAGEHIGFLAPGSWILPGHLLNDRGDYKVVPLEEGLEREAFLESVQGEGVAWVYLSSETEKEAEWLEEWDRADKVYENEAASVWYIRRGKT